MDNKKFETLIDLIINENEEQARALFHDIVVEKSREIYESIMDEEGMGGQVGDLLDEIGAEEEGMTEEEDDLDLEVGDDDGEEVVDLDADELEGETDDADVADKLDSIEDKLDQLMAEFEEIMGDDAEEVAADDEEQAADDEEAGEEEMFESEEDDEEDDEEDTLEESVQLKNVPGLYGSKIGGDNGAQTKSPGLQNSGQAGMDSKPVKFSGNTESVPTSPKKPSDYLTKGEGNLPGAGNFKNVPGKDGSKLAPAPKPVTAQATGVNTTTPFPKG